MLHGVNDRKAHITNVMIICVAAVLHNLLIDIGDKVSAMTSQKEKQDMKLGSDGKL